MKKCLTLCKQLMKRKGGGLFSEPIDPVALGLP